MALTDFAREVLADGPVGYWRPGAFGNDGDYSGGIAVGQSGLRGGYTGALSDGATGRVTVPNSEALNPPKITMEALVRRDGPTGLQQRILEEESFAGTTRHVLSILPMVTYRWNSG